MAVILQTVNKVPAGITVNKYKIKMKYIIVGAVAGGASTAARLRRMDEHAEIVIFEKG